MIAESDGFSARSRSALLQRASRHVQDLLVIGGGITGAGILRDAALRGLRVLLLERNDFASGTSSRSSCLVHGGLRYMRNAQFGFVRESLRERNLLHALAPDLVRPVPFLVPFFRGGPNRGWELRLAMLIYRVLGGGSVGVAPGVMSRRRLLEFEPMLERDRLRGAALYSDCLTDDVRLTLAVMQDGARAGGRAINYAEVLDFVHDGGRVAGVRVRDRLTGDEGVVRARAVVNAAGPWAMELAERDRHHGDTSGTKLTFSKGTHVIFRCRGARLEHAAILNPPDRRSVMALPRGDLIMVGPTETPYDGDLNNVTAEPDEVKYLLETMRLQAPNLNLDEDSIVSSFAGVRPLIGAGGTDADSAKLGGMSRSHRVVEGDSGLLSVLGGKLTIFRQMAEDVVDVVADRLRRGGFDRNIAPCRTREIPLRAPAPTPGQLLARAHERGLNGCLDDATAGRLVTTYGADSLALVDLIAEDPDLARPLDDGVACMRGEVVYAALSEMATTVGDFLVRRSRLTRELSDQGRQIVPEVARLMQRTLDWPDKRSDRELARFEKEAQLCTAPRPGGNGA